MFNLFNKQKVIGKREARLFDKSGNPKKMFQWNKLGYFLGTRFNFDPQISILLGKWTFDPVIANLVTTVGKQVEAKQLNGVSSTAVTYMAIGTSGTAPAAGDTTLGAEISTNGGSRAAATCSNQTTTTTGDTARWVLTYTFTGSLAIQEEGLLDASSNGHLLAHDVFSTINVVNTDTLQITHNIQFT